MQKLTLHSPDLTQRNIAKLRTLFPGCVTEAADANGKLRLAVDFDQLRQELSDHVVDGPQERYRLDWPGKREALAAANAPVAKTLRPARAESVNFDATRNLFIEGDNLEALKLLQETYLGAVKMIFIDPPYNTGSDFIYNDDFAECSSTFLVRSNQKDAAGNRLVANPETSGRFHSDWLSMIYARLRLARTMLRPDGVIFISIDDGEAGNLRKCCDEVFGDNNLVANIVWQKKYTRANDARWFSGNHDHILCYAREKSGPSLNLLPRSEGQIAAYSNPDNHPKGPWKSTPLHAKSGVDARAFTFGNGVTWAPPAGTFRRFSDEALKRLDEGGEIWFGADGTQTPSRKSFLSEVKGGVSPVTIWPCDEAGHNHEANSELKAAGLGGLFDNPKPTRLIQRMLTLATGGNDIVMDFFAGSGTTAHAVLKQNAEDGANRTFIVVQLPEETAPASPARKAGFTTIAELAKERIRRAGAKLLNGACAASWQRDVGFRVLKIDTSNMRTLERHPGALRQADLLDAVDTIKPDRTAEDLLFQVLTEWGAGLTRPIRREVVQGKTVFFVGEGEPVGSELAACFDTGISDDVITSLAMHRTLRVVFRDDSFVSDAAKINAERIFRALSPGTEVKSI